MKRTLLLGSAWTASAAAAVGLGFLAISLVDASASDSGQVLPAAATTSAADDSSAPAAPAPAAGQQVTDGGTVYGSCDGGLPVVASAPAAGWWLDDSSDAGQVEFQNGTPKVEVRVTCVDGVAQFSVEGPRADDSGGGRDDDDSTPAAVRRPRPRRWRLRGPVSPRPARSYTVGTSRPRRTTTPTADDRGGASGSDDGAGDAAATTPAAAAADGARLRRLTRPGAVLPPGRGGGRDAPNPWTAAFGRLGDSSRAPSDVLPVPAHPARRPGRRRGPQPPAARPRRLHPAGRARRVFTWLPLGYRVFRKVERVVREEMDAMGAQEVHFPALLPREPYEATGRWTEYGDNLFRLQDRRGDDYLLGPTHEEMFTLLVKDLYSLVQGPAALALPDPDQVPGRGAAPGRAVRAAASSR